MQQVQEARKRRREREKQKRREGVQQRQQVEAGLAAFSSRDRQAYQRSLAEAEALVASVKAVAAAAAGGGGSAASGGGARPAQQLGQLLKKSERALHKVRTDAAHHMGQDRLKRRRSEQQGRGPKRARGGDAMAARRAQRDGGGGVRQAP